MKKNNPALTIGTKLPCPQYRFPPTLPLQSRKEEQAYKRAEVIMDEFVNVMLHFDAKVEIPGVKRRSSFAPLPVPVYYRLRDMVMDILLGKCQVVLVDGEWLRIRPEGEYEKAFGPRPQRCVKRRTWWGFCRRLLMLLKRTGRRNSNGQTAARG